eukprot:tig00000984_g5985.t1
MMQQAGRRRQSLHGIWSFSFFEDGNLPTRSPANEVKLGEKSRIPGAWQADRHGLAPGSASTFLPGLGVYRQTFVVDGAFERRRIFLRIERAKERATLWVASPTMPAARFELDAFPADVELTPHILPGAPVTLTLAVEAGGGGWGGLAGELLLEARPRTFIESLHVLPDPASGTVRVRARLDGPLSGDQRLELSVLGRGGAAVPCEVRGGALSGGELDAVLAPASGPLEPWLPDAGPEGPALYTLRAALHEGAPAPGGPALDAQERSFGLCGVAEAAGRAAVPGGELLLRACIDPLHLPRDLVPPPDARFFAERLAAAARLGFNCLVVPRASPLAPYRAGAAHAALPEELLAAADRAGLLVALEGEGAPAVLSRGEPALRHPSLLPFALACPATHPFRTLGPRPVPLEWRSEADFAARLAAAVESARARRLPGLAARLQDAPAGPATAPSGPTRPQGGGRGGPRPLQRARRPPRRRGAPRVPRRPEGAEVRLAAHNGGARPLAPADGLWVKWELLLSGRPAAAGRLAVPLGPDAALAPGAAAQAEAPLALPLAAAGAGPAELTLVAELTDGAGARLAAGAWPAFLLPPAPAVLATCPGPAPALRAAPGPEAAALAAALGLPAGEGRPAALLVAGARPEALDAAAVVLEAGGTVVAAGPEAVAALVGAPRPRPRPRRALRSRLLGGGARSEHALGHGLPADVLPSHLSRAFARWLRPGAAPAKPLPSSSSRGRILVPQAGAGASPWRRLAERAAGGLPGTLEGAAGPLVRAGPGGRRLVVGEARVGPGLLIALAFDPWEAEGAPRLLPEAEHLLASALRYAAFAAAHPAPAPAPAPAHPAPAPAPAPALPRPPTSPAEKVASLASVPAALAAAAAAEGAGAVPGPRAGESGEAEEFYLVLAEDVDAAELPAPRS